MEASPGIIQTVAGNVLGYHPKRPNEALCLINEPPAEAGLGQGKRPPQKITDHVWDLAELLA